MKKIIYLLLFAALAVSGYAQQGDASAGLKFGYAFEFETAVFGVDFRYNIMPDIRIAPSITHMFKGKGVSGWYIDFDGHYVIDLANDFSFYPIGGIALSIWDVGEKGRHTRLGPNIGLGGEYRVIDDLSIGMDFKYNITGGDFHQAILGVRFAYQIQHHKR
ncbi:MAG: porin family protein [Tannerella sp.]|jgi:opacity protein-like surface antigen|nr:porin family protein [Tannerella sp.]